MADVDIQGRGDFKEPVQPTPSYGVRLEEAQHPNQTGSALEKAGAFTAFDQSWGATPDVAFNAPGLSSGSAGAGAVAIHPFKLERFIDASGSIRTRVYRGYLRYCLNTFKTIIEDDTKTTVSYGSQGSSSAEITGSSDAGSGTSAHTHTLPVLNNQVTTADRFVCVNGQAAGQGILKDVASSSFEERKNPENIGTGIYATEFPVGDTFGSIFLKWKVVLDDDTDLSNLTINAGDVTIHRDADVTKEAHELSDDDQFPALEADAQGAGMGDFNRGGETEAERTAYFYVKLGISHPAVEGTIKSIEQITYDNINWTPLIISRASGP